MRITTAAQDESLYIDCGVERRQAVSFRESLFLAAAHLADSHLSCCYGHLTFIAIPTLAAPLPALLPQDTGKTLKCAPSTPSTRPQRPQHSLKHALNAPSSALPSMCPYMRSPITLNALNASLSSRASMRLQCSFKRALKLLISAPRLGTRHDAPRPLGLRRNMSSLASHPSACDTPIQHVVATATTHCRHRLFRDTLTRCVIVIAFPLVLPSRRGPPFS